MPNTNDTHHAADVKTLHDMGYANVRNLGGFKNWVDGGGEIEKA